jgi:hypothetical protein
MSGHLLSIRSKKTGFWTVLCLSWIPVNSEKAQRVRAKSVYSIDYRVSSTITRGVKTAKANCTYSTVSMGRQNQSRERECEHSDKLARVFVIPCSTGFDSIHSIHFCVVRHPSCADLDFVQYFRVVRYSVGLTPQRETD